MKAKFYSHDKAGVANGIFVERGQHGEVRFYARKKWADDVHAALYILIDGFMVSTSVTVSGLLLLEKNNMPTDHAGFVAKLADAVHNSNFLVNLHDWCALGLNREEWQARKDEKSRQAEARRAESEERERAREQAEAARYHQYLDNSMYAIAQGDFVDGEALLDVANFLSVDVHSRTKGMLLKRIVSISEDSARVHGKGGAGLAFQVYRDVKANVIELLGQGKKTSKLSVEAEQSPPQQNQDSIASCQLMLI